MSTNKVPVRPKNFTNVVDGSEYGAIDEPGGRRTTNTGNTITNNAPKRSINMLRFPADVDTDGQGHYINFKIHVSEGGKASSVTSGDVKKMSTKLANGNTVAGTPNFKSSRKGTKATDRTFQAQKPPSRQLATAISLYMPPSIQTSYGATYQDKEIGQITEALMSGYLTATDSVRSGDNYTTTGLKVGASALNEIIAGAASKWAKALDSMGVTGIEAMMGITTGMVQSNRMELLFERMERRKFSYTFTFVPTTKQEAVDIQKIVFLFKLHMHPEYADGYGNVVAKFLKYGKGLVAGSAIDVKGVVSSGVGKAADFIEKNPPRRGRIFRIPDTFDIEYMMVDGQQNNFLHKISTCHLTNMSLTYGGDKFRAYDITEGIFGKGSPPQQVVMSLDFQEIEVMTKESIAHNF